MVAIPSTILTCASQCRVMIFIVLLENNIHEHGSQYITPFGPAPCPTSSAPHVEKAQDGSPRSPTDLVGGGGVGLGSAGGWGGGGVCWGVGVGCVGCVGCVLGGGVGGGVWCVVCAGGVGCVECGVWGVWGVCCLSHVKDWGHMY